MDVRAWAILFRDEPAMPPSWPPWADRCRRLGPRWNAATPSCWQLAISLLAVI